MAGTIRPYLGATVLEIGAGMGNLSRQLAPRRRRYIATDIDAEHLTRLKSELLHRPRLEVRQVDLTNPAHFEDFRGQMESVVCLNVLEHVADDAQALRNIRSALAPGGRAIVLVPEGMEIYGQLDKVLGHCRRYSRAELQQRMEQAGFRVERILDFNRIARPGWYLTGRLLKRNQMSAVQLWIYDRLVWLWRRIDGLLPWPGVSLIAIARKPESGARIQ